MRRNVPPKLVPVPKLLFCLSNSLWWLHREYMPQTMQGWCLDASHLEMHWLSAGIPRVGACCRTPLGAWEAELKNKTNTNAEEEDYSWFQYRELQTLTCWGHISIVGSICCGKMKGFSKMNAPCSKDYEVLQVGVLRTLTITCVFYVEK